MSKKLSVSKSQIFALVLLAAAAIGRAMAVMFRKGKPSVEALVFGVLMCLIYVLLLAWKFPAKKEEFFTGQTVFRVLTVGVVFIGAISGDYINAAFNFVLTMIPVALFCASDIKFVPISVVVSLVMSAIVMYQPFAFAVIPGAIIMLLVLVAPKLKGSKAWEKIVFSGALLSLTASLGYIVYQMRFIFSFSTLTTSLTRSIPLLLIAIVFAVCAFTSLKEVKAPKSKKKSKKNYVVKEKKADYIGALAYAAGAVYAVASAMIEGKFSICCLAALLTAMFIMCKNGTELQLVTDKAVGSLTGVVDKLTKEEKE